MAFFMRDIPLLPDNAPKAKIKKAEYSRWGDINKNLLCQIYIVNKEGEKQGDYVVEAAITEGNLELASQYSSPFSGSNLDQRFPTLMAAIQNGELVSSVGAISSGTGNLLEATGKRIKAATLDSSNAVVRGASAAVDAFGTVLAAPFSFAADLLQPSVSDVLTVTGKKVEELAGRSNFTRINSVMIYNSTEAVKLSITLFFRAWEDAKTEVEAPLSLLEQWALPQEMGNSIIDGIFSTKIPPFIAINYAGRTYLPFLIESVSSPLVVERDSNLNRLAATVTLSLVSRAAWDAGDIRKLYGY
jgi:hypothetical protein